MTTDVSHEEMLSLAAKCIMLPQIGIIQTGQIEGKTNRSNFYIVVVLILLCVNQINQGFENGEEMNTCYTITVQQCLNIFTF